MGNDAGTKDKPTLQYALDCGQGAGFSAWSTTKTLICPAIPDQAPALPIRAKVRDKDGGERLYTINLSIINVAPVAKLVATTATTLPVGGTLSVQGSFTDPGKDSPWSYTLTWGDGVGTVTGTAASATEAVVRSRTFNTAGTFYVQLSVTDKDGATGRSARIKVTVSPQRNGRA